MERWIILEADEKIGFNNKETAKKMCQKDEILVRIFNEEELKEFAQRWFTKHFESICESIGVNYLEMDKEILNKEFEQLYEKEKENG